MFFWPQHVWRYCEAVQQASYAEGCNVTEPGVLAAIVESLGLPRAEVDLASAYQAMRNMKSKGFRQSQACGIHGSAPLMAKHGDQLHLVDNALIPIWALRERLASAAGAHDRAH